MTGKRDWKSLLLPLCASALSWLAPLNAQVAISEVMSSNATTHADENGEYEDWIELRNTGATSVNLDGYGLTDNLSNPFKWTFGPTVIEPGGYLLVWASGKDRQRGVPQNGLFREVYYGISGSSVSDLINSGRLESGPDESGLLTNLFETPVDMADDYGQRVSGLLNPPATGEYRFWIASDDGGNLYLSTDESPANAVRIAHVPGWTNSRQWTKYPEQESAPIHLEAGKRYYMMALMKEGGGGDNLAVRWRKPDGVFETPMPAGHFTTLPPDAHTNFSISAAGETIRLTAPGGAVVDTVAVPALPRDVSYGRSPDDPDVWRYFREATPGAANDATGYQEVIRDRPSVSREGGFYDEAFQLALSGASGTTILYTLDGSIPDPANLGGRTYSYKNRYPRNPGDAVGVMLTGTIGTLAYSGPLEIRNRSGEPNKISQRNTTFDISSGGYAPTGPVFKGTVVRSRLVKEGAIPGPVITHSYFVGPNVSNRYQLPVLSLNTDEDTLFDHFHGIYNAGIDFEEWRASSGGGANGSSPANYQRRGSNAEHPVHLEIFDPVQGRAFSQNLGYRISGGWSRAHPQKSIRLYAKNDYDSDNWVHYPLIPGLTDHNGAPLESFRRFVLRNSGNDYGQTRFRDAFIQRLSAPLGFDTQGWQPVIHFINGEYWGHINIRERIDRFYIGTRHGIDPDHIAILTNDAQISDGRVSDREHFLALRSYIQNNSMTNPTHYAEVGTRMDIRNFLLYNVAQIYANNQDWPHNNTECWRSREPGASPTSDGRWRWIMYDTDFGFGHVGDHNANTLNHALNGSDWSRIMLVRLLNNQGFRNTFINAFADHMATTFRPARATELAHEMRGILAPYMAEHRQRWRDSGGESHHTNAIVSFAQNRPAVMRQHIISRFGLSSANAPVTLDTGGTRVGHFIINTLTLNSQTPGIANSSSPFPWTANYFSGVPVTVTAVAEPGHRFIGWQQYPGYASETITLNPAGGIQLTALFEEAPLPEPPQLLHHWDFEAGTVAAPAHTVGGGLLAIVPGPQTETLINGPAEGFGSAHLRVNFPIGSILQLSVPTKNYEEITLDFLTRRSGSGAGLQTLSYTLDGQTWTEHQSYTVDAANPQLRSFDFSGIPGAADNLDFALRVSFQQGSGGDVGNNRFDDIAVRGVLVSDPNFPPEIVAAPAGSLALRAGGEATFDVDAMFYDPEGDPLVFSVHSEHGHIVQADLDGGTLTLHGLAPGESGIVIQAEDDHDNVPIALSFRVLVHPAAHDLAGEAFAFTAWEPQSPALTYPAHFIFLQSERNDPDLAAPLDRAYHIPAEDAAVPEDVDFPYAAASRTRINGLGEDGISFINTGRGRDLGAALLAIDTRGLESAEVSFIAGTHTVNSRIYALRLQYRTGHEGPFRDFPEPVEYIRSLQQGDTAEFGPIALPSEALDQEYIQLAWRYHHLEGDSGPRAEIRLDDIVVTGQPAAGEPSGFAAWRIRQFPDPGDLADPTISGPQADPFGIGVPNLLRYALGIDEPQDRSAHLPRLAGDPPAAPVFRFPFDPAKDDLVWLVEASADLTDWTEILFDSRDEPQAIPDGDGWLEIEDPETSARRFYRLRVLIDESSQ